MMRTAPAHPLLIAALAILLAATGCSDDDPIQVQENPVPGPESPDLLMLQLMGAYEARNVGTYLALLDPEFEMFLTAETMGDFPDLGPTLDYGEEERIHNRMFSGQNVTDPQGNLVPGVQDIAVSVFIPMDAWSATGASDPIQDAVWAPYQVVIHFDRGQSYAAMRVEGILKVYARAHETTSAGKKETYYLLAGMTDLTYLAKNSEIIAWGAAKALYR
jgi:hypothetical protein